MVGGEETSLAKLGNAERDSLMGLHRAFTQQQIPVDFVHPSDVVAGRISPYKILFLPFAVMLSKNVAEGVKRYVQNGGTAVAEARTAWNDERGFSSDVIPGFGLAEVFRAREKIIRPVERPEILVEATAGLPGLAAGEKVLGEAYEEDIEPLNESRVLARFASGEPAVVEHSFGKGKAILVGSFLALACQRHPEGSAKQLLLAMAQAAGVAADVEVSGAGTSEVEVRRLVSDRFQILFAFNHSDAPADSTISVHLPWQASEARDLASGQSVPLNEKAGVAEIELNLNGGEIRVLRLNGR
jgi:beta-galactosidase